MYVPPEKQHGEQNDIAGKALSKSDLAQREEDIVRKIAQSTDFQPTKLLSRSAWYVHDGNIGAFHYLGTFEGKPAVLKVQGVQPESSEAFHLSMAAEAAENSKSSRKSLHIRPPRLFFHLPWNDTQRFEALILEHITGRPVVSVPATADELKDFFTIYERYADVFLSKPWVKLPDQSIGQDMKEKYETWYRIRKDKFPHHPLIEDGDTALIDSAVAACIHGYENVARSFQHGHFSHLDVVRQDDEIVLLSHLYWSWRPPMYDRIFAYHWHRFSTPGVEGATPEIMDTQRALWRKQIYGTYTREELRLLRLALLERAAAGLLLDGLSADPNKPMTPYILDTVRSEIRELLGHLS